MRNKKELPLFVTDNPRLLVITKTGETIEIELCCQNGELDRVTQSSRAKEIADRVGRLDARLRDAKFLGQIELKGWMI